MRPGRARPPEDPETRSDAAQRDELTVGDGRHSATPAPRAARLMVDDGPPGRAERSTSAAATRRDGEDRPAGQGAPPAGAGDDVPPSQAREKASARRRRDVAAGSNPSRTRRPPRARPRVDKRGRGRARAERRNSTSRRSRAHGPQATGKEEVIPACGAQERGGAPPRHPRAHGWPQHDQSRRRQPWRSTVMRSPEVVERGGQALPPGPSDPVRKAAVAREAGGASREPPRLPLPRASRHPRGARVGGRRPRATAATREGRRRARRRRSQDQRGGHASRWGAAVDGRHAPAVEGGRVKGRGTAAWEC